MVSITAKQVGRSKNLIPDWYLKLPEDWVGKKPTLRELLSKIVETEVTAFHQRQAQNQLLRVLTSSEIAQAAHQGKVTMGGTEFQQAVEPSQAIENALQAFTDGLYFVFIDDQQQESLEQIVSLTPDSQVLFLRLVPLVGG